MYLTTPRLSTSGFLNGLGQPAPQARPQPSRPLRCESLVLTIPRTYAELERIVKGWIATCVQSRTVMGGAPIHRENILVTNNPSLVQLWWTVLRTMPGQTVKLLANYAWGRQGTESIRFSIPTTRIDFAPEEIVVRRPAPPVPPVRRKPVPPPPVPPHIPPHQPPPSQPPRRVPWPPKIVVPHLPDWDDFRKHPNIVQPLQRSRNWALDALTAAATVLGTTVSLAVRTSNGGRCTRRPSANHTDVYAWSHGVTFGCPASFFTSTICR